jgi:hypothetical protein
MGSSAVDFLSQQRRRVDRGRQIVARQRELVAKHGDRLPVAVALLETYERTVRLFELGLDRCERRVVLAEQSAEKVVEAAEVTQKLTYQEQMRAVAHLMEVLRSGGYHCELAEETLQ